MTVWRVQVRGSFLVDTDEPGALAARDAAKRLLVDCFEGSLLEAGTLTVREDLYQRSLLPAEKLSAPLSQVHVAEHDASQRNGRRW